MSVVVAPILVLPSIAPAFSTGCRRCRRSGSRRRGGINSSPAVARWKRSRLGDRSCSASTTSSRSGSSSTTSRRQRCRTTGCQSGSTTGVCRLLLSSLLPRLQPPEVIGGLSAADCCRLLAASPWIHCRYRRATSAMSSGSTTDWPTPSPSVHQPYCRFRQPSYHRFQSTESHRVDPEAQT